MGIPYQTLQQTRLYTYYIVVIHVKGIFTTIG